MTADRLPSQVPEKQLFDVATIIDVIGAIDETSTLHGIIADGGEGDGEFRAVFNESHPGMPREYYDNNHVKNYWNSIGVTKTHLTNVSPVFFDSFTQPKHLIKDISKNDGTTWQDKIDIWRSMIHPATITELSGSSSIPTDKISPGNELAVVKYKDHILTNSGKNSDNRYLTIDTLNKTAGQDNIVTDKLITYSGTDGSHLIEENLSP